MRIGLATEAREGPNNQDKAEHVIALSDHLVEGMKAPIIHLGLLKRLRTILRQLELCSVFLALDRRRCYG